MPAEKVFELISPTSDLGVDLFKADLMNDDCRLTNFSVGVLAFISDINGVVKSANVKMSIANVLKLFTGPFMKTFLEGFTENYETETRNLLCGHVERIRIEGLDCFVFVKLQFWCGEENKLFIWTLTKANIIPSTADDCEIVFPILGEIGLFSFSKLSFSFGIDTACKLVNFPADLNKYLPLLKCETNSLSDLFDIDSSLLSEALNTKRQPQILNYMDSFDALPETGCYKEDPIFTSVAKLKSGSSLFSIKIFQSVIHKNSGTVFPVSMTYDDHEALRSDSVKDFPDDINVSSKFQFIRLLSQSDHSIVYLARNELGQVVIVKKSLHPNSLEANFYQFVLSNSDRCSYIECPLIIDQEERLLVFDYHENRMDLFNFVETKRQLSDSEVKNIFLQICIAVKFLHSNNIVHRDIKPENVLIDEDTFDIRLIDFGTATFIQNDQLSTFKEYVGTFAYAPVEALKGLNYDGFKQDIWCLGIVLYILAYSSFPFKSAKESLQGFLRLPISRPAPLVSLLRQLLDTNPLRRPNINYILDSEFFK